jgi:shikimate dehydrogenase
MVIIRGTTRVVGLLGWPVTHSLSPAMHNAAARALGLDLVYVPLPVAPEAVGAAVRGLAALGFLGANVTVPHKQAVLPHLDHLDEVAQALGAVNTIVVAGDGAPALHGANTDAAGLLADLDEQGVTIDRRDCLVLGAGGAARAAAYGLAKHGGHVRVLARRPEQASQLVAALRSHVSAGALSAHDWPELPALAADLDQPLIVNATPVGMGQRPGVSPWPGRIPFPAGSFVYDMVYQPAETRLLRQARAAGCAGANGLGMLLHQGALAFELWTGLRPDIAAMRRALEEAAA